MTPALRALRAMRERSRAKRVAEPKIGTCEICAAPVEPPWYAPRQDPPRSCSRSCAAKLRWKTRHGKLP